MKSQDADKITTKQQSTDSGLAFLNIRNYSGTRTPEAAS